MAKIKKHSIIEYWKAECENMQTTQLFKSTCAKLRDGRDVGEIYESIKKMKGIDLIDFPEGLSYGIKG